MDTNEDVEAPILLLKPLSIPYKTLLGAGPANCPPRVVHSAALPLVGHLHKECLAVSRYYIIYLLL
jgi:alanine-glyoxylate transaminase/serine-glyoxylate transaminase/serine-pyruvate transaminase